MLLSSKHLNGSKKLLFFVIFACSLLFLNPVKCQSDDGNERSLSTSIAGMEMLLETERQLLTNLENYANALEAKLAVIRRAIKAMRAENLKSVSNAERYLSNPLNSFALIRRMHIDWIYWELFLKSPIGEVEIDAIQKQRMHLPTSTELDEASSAIYRLQITYNLKPTDIAAGLLNGQQYNTTFSAHDCFAIGYHLFSQEFVYHAGFWLYTAIQRYEDADNDVNAILGFDKSKIFALYAETLLKQNRFADAVSVLNVAIESNSNNAQLMRKKMEVELEMKTTKEKPMKNPVDFPQSYELCCRGEFDQHLSRLHCRYNTTTHPFLKLAPLKMEELHLDPYMVLYHDVISDVEIAVLKELALPKLKRATVYSTARNRSEVERGRTSKFSWFGTDLNDVTRRLNRRIADMSGFDLNGSEMIQVMNYGLGGHYNTHYDFFNVSMDSHLVRNNGDRISTVLFYLTDVEQGGATVFPNLRTTVYPRKGTAVMWYNLNSRGEGDYRTLHAACPVIVGSKWVTNKWIRERAQLFRRPCNKNSE